MNTRTLFFADGIKTIDFVLVYRITDLNEASETKLERFLDNLKRTGLYLEISTFTTDWNTWFVKIHIPKDVCVRYADIFSIDLTFNSVEKSTRMKTLFRFMTTPLTRLDLDDPLYGRAPETMSGMIPKDVTSAERIMVVNQILIRTRFSREKGSYGIARLLKEKVFLDAFPLHEGSHVWPETGPLTDRQLLSKFWGSARNWYKQQPLNVIEKYYGTELAFYFAWLGHYIRMLIPVTVLSILCVIYGLVTMETSENTRSKEICNSDLLMCPRCNYVFCAYGKLSNSCMMSYMTYFFDNPTTIAYAIIVSFWSTVFMETWGRKQNILQLQWNVKHLENDISMRPEYATAAVKIRVSPITGLPDPRVPKRLKIATYTVTVVSVVLMLIIITCATFGIVIYRLTVNSMLSKTSDFTVYSQLIASTTGSFMSVVCIFIFRMIYSEITLWLTDLENHRTQYEYDHSYIYKSFALAFTNNYAAVFYISFFKGMFFTHPGDKTLWTRLGGIASDVCDPTSCILDLSIQLMIIMSIKLGVTTFLQIFFPVTKRYLARKWYKVHHLSEIPRYEEDYLKDSLKGYYLIDEYMELVIQYGFVVFFVAGFPLMPLLALIHNLVELRLDAYKITTHYRRPIPNKVAGIGAWMGILQALTYVGVATNAGVIAFTSDFVPKEIYKYSVDPYLRGFVNTTISEFLRSEIADTDENGTCYYRGRRYPSDHPQKYELTTDYWFLLAMRFIVVVLFEHLVMITNGIIAYAIPDVPAHVTERLALEEKKNKEIMMAAFDKKYGPTKRRASVLNDFG